MRKLSSSPHLLGICEEGEDGSDVPQPVHSTPRSVSTIPNQKGPHLGRGNRSASIGFGGFVSLTKSNVSAPKEETSYSSVRVIRPRQAVVSPDMARRYDQHQRFISRSRRSTSCSSSETSDDDTNERRFNLIGSKYCKRNQDDKNNDDDGTGGGGGNSGPKRSNSMKEQTIPEEPTSSEKQGNTQTEKNKGTQHMAGGFLTSEFSSNSERNRGTQEIGRGFLTPDSPCSSKSIYSESENSVFSRHISPKSSNESDSSTLSRQTSLKSIYSEPEIPSLPRKISPKSLYSEPDNSNFSRQISVPLQPILEHDSFPRRCLFNKSATAKEALHDWLQESLNFQPEKKVSNEPESPVRVRWFCNNDPLSRYGDHFYRPLRRSKSLEAGMIVFQEDDYPRNESSCSDFNDSSQDMDFFSMSESTRTTDSGCSSDDERRNNNKKLNIWLPEFTNIGHDLEEGIPMIPEIVK